MDREKVITELVIKARDYNFRILGLVSFLGDNYTEAVRAPEVRHKILKELEEDVAQLKKIYTAIDVLQSMI